MTGKSQAEAVSVLRNTKLGSTVCIVVSRQVVEEDDQFTVPRELVRTVHVWVQGPGVETPMPRELVRTALGWVQASGVQPCCANPKAPFTQDTEVLANAACKKWNTLWSMGVFTQYCKQHQRICMQICMQTCLRPV